MVAVSNFTFSSELEGERFGSEEEDSEKAG